jgi:hypothetical protein
VLHFSRRLARGGRSDPLEGRETCEGPQNSARRRPSPSARAASRCSAASRGRCSRSHGSGRGGAASRPPGLLCPAPRTLAPPRTCHSGGEAGRCLESACMLWSGVPGGERALAGFAHALPLWTGLSGGPPAWPERRRRRAVGIAVSRGHGRSVGVAELRAFPCRGHRRASGISMPRASQGRGHR